MQAVHVQPDRTDLRTARASRSSSSLALQHEQESQTGRAASMPVDRPTVPLQPQQQVARVTVPDVHLRAQRGAQVLTSPLIPDRCTPAYVIAVQVLSSK
jgi:hypothetical protein